MLASKDYLSRSGDDSIATYGNLETDPKNGFCIWDLNENSIVLIQVYGNGAHWNSWAEDKAKELGLDKIFFATKRDPKGFCRKYNYKVTGYILEREIQWVE